MCSMWSKLTQKTSVLTCHMLPELIHYFSLILLHKIASDRAGFFDQKIFSGNSAKLAQN